VTTSHLGEPLQDSVNYARKIVHAVTVQELSHATPCAEWDLRALLNHLNDSLATLCTARRTGRVGLDPLLLACDKDDGPLATFDRYSAVLLEHGPRRRVSRGVLVGDLPLAEHLLVAAGAIEISVHGWDIGQAIGRPDSLPEGLATELLTVAPLVVDDTCRSPLFGPIVAVPPTSGPATQLLAYLGRQESSGASAVPMTI
jgi:uncharacterized protein (TIGR03086 family)